MSENPYAILGLVPGPVGDSQVVDAYERRLIECRKRIADQNRRAAREESLIYAYAVLRDPRRREHYLDALLSRKIGTGSNFAAANPSAKLQSPREIGACPHFPGDVETRGAHARKVDGDSPLFRGHAPSPSIPDSAKKGTVPYGKNKPDSIRRLCGCIDNAMIRGEIDPLRRRAIHTRARILGVTPFEAELLMASALQRHRRKTAGVSEAEAPSKPKPLAKLIATCLTVILVALFLYTRL